jgi:hypothetical protein
VSTNMPVSSKEEAYAVVAFLLRENGIASEKPLDAAVAPTIRLR